MPNSVDTSLFIVVNFIAINYFLHARLGGVILRVPDRENHQNYDENKARNLKLQNVVCPRTRATTNMTMLV